MGTNWNLNEININIYMIKLFFIELFVYFTYLKIINYKNKNLKKILICFIFILFNTVALSYVKFKINYLISVILLIMSLSFLCSKLHKIKLISSVFIVMVSLGINYIVYFCSIITNYLLNLVYVIHNDSINCFIIIYIHILILVALFKIKRIKNGISYINKKSKNEYLNLMVLNISIIIIISFIFFSHMDSKKEISKDLFFNFIVVSMIMFITIKSSIELYYKQKLLIQDLNETRTELENKKKEIEELEAENLRFSKKAHSLAHKQKSLEFKINKILMNSEIAEEIGLKRELQNISKQLLDNSKLPKLDKTGIFEIDDMFDVMQEECRLNGIDFVLQLKGNIYQMINHHITKEELAILLADHIKDAIIAINNSDNLNKSIMVRLGKIEECFAIYFYDSGVEFPKKVFDNLGKKPITTYSDKGGTGMGFMNTFDLLNKYSASLIIDNIGKPNKDNYTKIIKIKFDNKKNLLFNKSSFNNK